MLQTIIAPTALPIDVAEARLQVKQDITFEDLLFNVWIGAAAQFAESQTERTLLATRFRLVLDAFPGPSLYGVPAGVSFSLPGHAIQLPRSPLIQLVSIMYLDMGRTWQTMPAADYTVDDSGPLVRITPVFGKIWPITMPEIGAVRVLFDAGYATPMVADATADTITPGLWKTLAVGDPVRFANSGGALPAPLQLNTDYYVQSLVGNAIKVAATPAGAAINLTDTGTGLHTLGEIPAGIRGWMLMRIDSHFNHRGETTIAEGRMAAMPYIDRLLDPYRVVTM